ncbi:MAG: adenylate/guanylate cyclase domain-containing protein [Alphaproteobacteria bacterium]
MEQGLIAALSRVAAVGTHGYPPHVVRRLRIVNIAALAAALTSIGYAVFYAAYDFDTLKIAVFVNLGGAALSALVPLAHRANAYLGAIAFGLVFFAMMMFLSHLLGAETGIPLYLLLTPAAALLFFGAENIRLVVALAVVATGLYLAAVLTSPAANAVIMLDPALRGGIEIFSAVTFSAILLTIVFYAFQQLSRAEAAAEREHRRSERLLRNILPAAVAERLKEKPEEVIADSIPEATVLFADIVGFSRQASMLRPQQLVGLLDRVFTEFDTLTDRYRLEKIKTIGDAYMVAGGVPTGRPDHAAAVAGMALDLLAAVRRFNAEGGMSIEVRVGIHSGSLVAGVIGRRKFSYDVWGDTVNTASRLEAQGVPGRIHVSAATRALLQDRFLFEPHGAVEIKGKGPLSTYFLIGRNAKP